jgi:hypothetical protein
MSGWGWKVIRRWEANSWALSFVGYDIIEGQIISLDNGPCTNNNNIDEIDTEFHFNM